MSSVDCLGLDIGGVIAGRRHEALETFFRRSDHLSDPQVEGAFDGVRQVREALFGDRIYLVSKCGAAIERKTREWLAYHRFHELTGVRPSHVLFCDRREGKVGHARRHEITHFVDDRLDVLGYLWSAGINALYLFHPDENEALKFRQHAHGATRIVHTWPELVDALLACDGKDAPLGVRGNNLYKG